MAKMNVSYYSGEDAYSDGDVEEEILALVRAQTRIEDLDDVSFPVLYHLSSVRENILSWYPFREGASGLEIGSGCGAITGLLCRKLSRVVSVELSRRRADINFARHERLENLEIWVGNLNDMAFGETFDYIVLNGVFEYALCFTESVDPYRTFLKNVRRLLKPDGVILVAIENRLGLKYFAGAPEDHTDGYFDGLQGYEGNDRVRTFSRREWEEMMEAGKLKYYRFYYPYPDYKFPREIFTDESINRQEYGSPAWNFTKYRMYLFSENKLASSLCHEGVMQYFANSFLIEMSRRPLPSEHRVLYVKMNADRDRHFSTRTVIEERDGEKVVVKSPMTYEAKRHILAMQEHTQDYGCWEPVTGTMRGDSIVYPYLETESLAAQAAQAVRGKDARRLRELVGKVAQMCRGSCAGSRQKTVRSQQMSGRERAQFQKVFGAGTLADDLECIAPANIDLILDNIFERDGRYYVIDCEWVFDFPIPVSFILWRTVNEIYSRYPYFEETCPMIRFLEAFDISPGMGETFREWGTYFAEHYVGANRLARLSVPEIPVPLEAVRQREKQKDCMTGQLYVDSGHGFREEEKLVTEVHLADAKFSVCFDLTGYAGTPIQALRFDPLEGSPCICRIDRQRTEAKLTPANASGKVEKGDLFLTTDPIYIVTAENEIQTLKISGEILPLSMEEALARARGLLRGGRLAFWRK